MLGDAKPMVGCNGRDMLSLIGIVTFTLISILEKDYIQKRRGEPDLLSFEYNLLRLCLTPNLISK
jgi:hypothetical protein